jgi:hypothetical protein
LDTRLDVVINDEAAGIAPGFEVNRKQLDVRAALWAGLDFKRDIVAQTG